MKILQVISSVSMNAGGPPKAALEFSRELLRQGHQIDIFTTNVDTDHDWDVPFGTPVEHDGAIVYFHPVGWPRQWAFSSSLARALWREAGNYDLIYVYSVYMFPSAIAEYICRIKKIPYVVQPHGSLDPYIYQRHRGRKWWYEKFIEWPNLNRAAALHFTTEDEMNLVKPLGLKAPTFVAPYGLFDKDYHDLQKGYFRAEHSISSNKKIILFMGRINFKKGLDILAKAFARLCEKRDDLLLVIAGPDNNEGYKDEIVALLKTLNVFDQTLFTGILQGDKKLNLLADSDVFVLSSYGESFGIAVAEAMAANLPVVISNKVNIWREVQDASAGLVTDCDVDQVVMAIDKVLNDSNDAKAMGESGRRMVAQRYGWESVAREMLEWFSHALKGELKKYD